MDPVLLSLVQAALAGAIGGGAQTMTGELYDSFRRLVHKARRREPRNSIDSGNPLGESAEKIVQDLMSEAERHPKFARKLAEWKTRAEEATHAEGSSTNSVSGRVQGAVIQIGNRSNVESINLNEL